MYSIYKNVLNAHIWIPSNVNGHCVNVPGSLKHIVHHLSHVSTDVLLHLLQLKRKLIYKKHYLYHSIFENMLT